MDDLSLVKLKKNQKVILTNHHNQKLKTFCQPGDEYYNDIHILLKFHNLDQMLNISDKIIINDNRARLTVEKIIKKKREFESNLYSNNIKNNRNGRELKLYSNSRTNTSDINIVDQTMNSSIKTIIKTDRSSKTQMDSIDSNNSLNINLNQPKFNFDNNGTKLELKAIQRSKSDHLLNPDLSEVNFINRRSLQFKPTSLFNENTYEIVCSVDFDCAINKDSYFYFPSIDYRKYDEDILSPREVAEISFMSRLQVSFLNITLNNIDDINSFKEILGEDHSIKLMASITNLEVNIFKNYIMIYFFIYSR